MGSEPVGCPFFKRGGKIFVPPIGACTVIYCGSRKRHGGIREASSVPEEIWPPPSFGRMVVTALQGHGLTADNLVR
jgi:hypothetical protein